MQPTVSPWSWVSSWDRRARTRAAGEFARSRDRAAPRARERDKYAFYGLRKDSRHFIRNIPTIIDDDVPSRLDPLTQGLLLNRQWLPTTAPVTWRVDRYHDTEPWAVPDIKSIQSYRPYEPVSIVLPGEEATGPVLGAAGAAGAPRPTGPVAHSWSHGARGWAAGAVLLALLVLLVRAAENCLHRKLFRAIYAHTNVGAGELQQNEIRPGQYRLPGVRRQESDEWSTPNVMATSHNRDDAGSLTDLDDIEDYPDVVHHNNDMPPPYSECAHPSVININNNKYVSEEPPPPYSACYVSYTNPKDAEPQVHIRRQNDLVERAHSSTDIDNVQNDLIENRHRTDSFAMTTTSNESEDDASRIRTELVFDNGRIVERLSLDLNSNNNNETGVASNDNVKEQCTRHADSKDRVVFIDETTSESTSPDTALLV